MWEISKRSQILKHYSPKQDFFFFFFKGKRQSLSGIKSWSICILKILLWLEHIQLFGVAFYSTGFPLKNLFYRYKLWCKTAFDHQYMFILSVVECYHITWVCHSYAQRPRRRQGEQTLFCDGMTRFIKKHYKNMDVSKTSLPW